MEFFKKRTNFRFMPLRQRWYAISGVLILASLADARRSAGSTSASTSPAASCSS